MIWWYHKFWKPFSVPPHWIRPSHFIPVYFIVLTYLVNSRKGLLYVKPKHWQITNSVGSHQWARKPVAGPHVTRYSGGLPIIINKVPPISHKRDPGHCLLAEERSPVRKKPQKIEIKNYIRLGPPLSIASHARGSGGGLIAITEVPMLVCKTVITYLQPTKNATRVSAYKYRKSVRNIIPCLYILKTWYAFIVFNLHSSGIKYSYCTVDAGIIQPQTFYGALSGAVDCDTEIKVAGSIPDGVMGIFFWLNPSGYTALDSSANSNGYQEYFLGGEVKAAGEYGWQPDDVRVSAVSKSGSINLLEPSRPIQGFFYLHLLPTFLKTKNYEKYESLIWNVQVITKNVCGITTFQYEDTPPHSDP